MDFFVHIMWEWVKLTSNFSIWVEGGGFFCSKRDNLRAVMETLNCFWLKNEANSWNWKIKCTILCLCF